MVVKSKLSETDIKQKLFASFSNFDYKLFKNNTFLKRMLNKFYYRHNDLRVALEAREWEIKYKQQRIEFNKWQYGRK